MTPELEAALSYVDGTLYDSSMPVWARNARILASALRESMAEVEGLKQRNRELTYSRGPYTKRPIFYSDTVNGQQTCRDDLWAVTTKELNDIEAKDLEIAALKTEIERLKK